MSKSQEKQNDKMFQPKDPVYAKLIDELRLKIKHRKNEKPGSIRAGKVLCLHRFEEFNNVRAVTKFFSLYDLCENQYLRDQAIHRDYELGGDRSCFLNRAGDLEMVVLHIPKIDFKSQTFYDLASRLYLEVHFISSFKDPHIYTAACFSKWKKDESKGAISDKPAGILRKLSAALNTDIL